MKNTIEKINLQKILENIKEKITPALDCDKHEIHINNIKMNLTRDFMIVQVFIICNRKDKSFSSIENILMNYKHEVMIVNPTPHEKQIFGFF